MTTPHSQEQRLDLGRCPIIVHDEESACQAGEWVQERAHQALHPSDHNL